MIYDATTRTFTMRYGTRFYRIHTELLSGTSVTDLMNLDPDSEPKHRIILDILVLSTDLMLNADGPTVVQFPDGKMLDFKALSQIHAISPISNTKASGA